MKRIILSFAATALIAGGASAQNQVSSNDHTIPAVLTKQNVVPSKTVHKSKKSSAIVIWSEDFSSGIPATWTNAGFDVDPATGNFNPNPLCLWEYRGTATTPNNGTGGRGAFTGGAPITSPTAGNGFIIFDSDYLDNNGVPTGSGTGNSPAPHYGTLTTDVIDLTGYPAVQIELSSFARTFFGQFKVAISGDGGTTYPDTVQIHSTLAVNASSPNGDIVSADISSTAGGSANVKLQIIFDGIPGNANGSGYYEWMVDDIAISEIPASSFKFVDAGNAPAHDIIFPAGHPKYGNPQLEQAVQWPISFDSNILNFGFADQTNVVLNVDIIDESNGSVVTSLQSPALALLASGDTGTFVDFTTSGAWTPSMVGDYTAVFYVTSDSASAITPYDSVAFDINDLEHASHFGIIDNVVGIANGALVLAQALTFPAPVDTAGYVAISSIGMYISNGSDTTGSIIVEVYDTTGFSFGAGGGPAGSPYTVKVFQISASNTGTTANVDVTTNGNPLFLPSNAGYMVVLNLVSTAGDVRIGNDQTVRTPGGLIGLLATDGVWYGGFTNSDALSNLIINMRVVKGIGIEEAVMKQNSISLFPNPTNNGMVNFELALGGTYDIEVTSLTGQRVHAETITINGGEVLQRDFSHLKSGAYLVNFNSEEIQMTKKLVIE